jgi:VanZ family protein
MRHAGVIWFLAWLGWMAILFSLSAQERLPSVSTGLAWEDKAQHAVAYGLLALLSLGLVRALNVRRGIAHLSALAWAAVYGLSDEWHQSVVPGRDGDLLDWAADVVGAASVLALLALAQRLSRAP